MPIITMSTLPANSTFLPIMDDLLSPDFRPVLLPVQTPTEPYNSPSVEKFRPQAQISEKFKLNEEEDEKDPAAAKIQQWWKKKKSQDEMSDEVDLSAEDAKHSIRHSRSEDHIRYLEAEVTRLNFELTAEKKVRSLQLEAIKSLWSQVQHLSKDNASVMTQSMPNGLVTNAPKSPPKAMSMSFSAGYAEKETDEGCRGPCACSVEIQSLRENFSSEMANLRGMIDALNKPGDDGKGAVGHKRPYSLNIAGCSQTAPGGQPEEIQGYARDMASKLLENAVE